MKFLEVPRPISGGLILSYICPIECKHCMYACSPKWPKDWASLNFIKKILDFFKNDILPAPEGSNRIGINYGLHFTGGEPFLNYKLLLDSIKIAKKLDIPSVFVETNCFWCKNDEITFEKFDTLKSEGLDGILISVNPFILEKIPFEYTQRAIKIAKNIFNNNLLVYQDIYYRIFKKLNISGTIPFNNYLNIAYNSLLYAELIPMGRLVYKLDFLYKKYPHTYFFKETCLNELKRSWHVHFDNYGNYMAGYCGGITLGNLNNIDNIFNGIDLDDKPILKALTNNLESLFNFATENYNYKPLDSGYISKCHLCVDIRKKIVQETSEFKELNPIEFYNNLI